MSNRMTPLAAGSNSSVQPAAASLASVAESIISSSRPAFSATRARNASPFSAARQAAVAINRARLTLRACILSRQTSSAETARSIAASLIRREAATPSPRRMIRENASTTRKPVRGRTRDQEAAIVGAEIERRVGSLGMLGFEILSVIPPQAVTPHAIGRPAMPARSPSRRSTAVEAAGRRGLFLHPIPSCRAGTPGLDGRGLGPSSNLAKCISLGPEGPIPCRSRLLAMPVAQLSRCTKSTMSPDATRSRIECP